MFGKKRPSPITAAPDDPRGSVLAPVLRARLRGAKKYRAFFKRWRSRAYVLLEVCSVTEALWLRPQTAWVGREPLATVLL